MDSYNGFVLPHSLKQLKLNWASGGGLIDKKYEIICKLALHFSLNIILGRTDSLNILFL
jgi:hypothetical protein